MRLEGREDPGGNGARAAKVAQLMGNRAEGPHWPKAEECAVCLGEFEQGDQLRRMRCGHFFHCACIDEWLIGKGRARAASSGAHLPTCPLCKAPVLTEDEWAESGRLHGCVMRRFSAK